jgi:hypothetical protein
MKPPLARWIRIVGVVVLVTSATAKACIPIPANPEEDATVATGISVGRVDARHDFPTTAVRGQAVWVVTASTTLKGIMPRRLIVPLGCGGALVAVGDPVIVVQLGRRLITRPAGGEYEVRLLGALRMRGPHVHARSIRPRE